MSQGVKLMPLALVVVGLMCGCATNPVTGQSQFTLVSSSQELQIGREGYKAVVAEYGTYDAAAVQAYVDSVGQRVAKVSHLPNLEWHFTVVDDAAVNAFAMPGGYIYITRGILAYLNSEAQLAGVLGHEIGHVTARHSAAQITKQQLASLGLGLASMVSEGFQRYSNVAQTGLGLLFLKYSRENENQADELGVEYATKAGYDPREIPATYAMLKRVSDKSGQRLPTFLATHPDPGDRQNRTTALSQQAAAGKAGLQVRERNYLLHQQGLVFGRDPREGYFEGQHYFHPTLRFQIQFPSGWQTQDTRSAVMVGEPNQRAAMQLTLNEATQLSPSDYVSQLERSGRIAAAQGGSENIGGFPAWIGHVRVTAQDGTPIIYAASFITVRGGQMFRILGRSGAIGDPDDQRILQSMRSFASLTDPRRLAVRPDQVRVAPAASTGQFQTVIESMGQQALGLDDTSILNNLFPDQDVRRGQLLKIVVHG
ncbi:MAG: peptidase M48 [Candidatus Eisenbacteria bacterium]|uniref:Peptidase M48 n=1 Tax=Eiseniibacteriota bacterium TaxID=2212470 RepID=A0A538TUN7_UNCEI|nr:MAG: peptidase M48 [Candidatus Eisenbacteria bacterium]